METWQRNAYEGAEDNADWRKGGNGNGVGVGVGDGWVEKGRGRVLVGGGVG